MDNKLLYLSFDEIIQLHKKEIDIFGGSHGIRDRNLLYSAIGQADLFLFGEPFYKDAYIIAAVYAYHIIKNHPFVDGNKRTGILVSLIFLQMNNVNLVATKDEIYNLAIDIAASRINKDDVIQFFKEHTDT